MAKGRTVAIVWDMALRRAVDGASYLACLRAAAASRRDLQAIIRSLNAWLPPPSVMEKVRDIVGLSLSPPERALVLCLDQKARVQALDRTQPLLPMRPGQIERCTHDKKRHGTTSLFAALDVKAGTKPSRSVTGSPSVRAGTCTSRRPRPYGSTRSSASSHCSPSQP